MNATHGRVRALLRAVRQPHRLEHDALAIALRRSVGARDEAEAVCRVIDRALAPQPLLHEIIRRCDVGGEDTESVMSALYLSRRTFFRSRALAFAILASEIDRAVAAAGETAPDAGLLEALIAIDPPRARTLLAALSSHNGEHRLMLLRARCDAGEPLDEGELDAFAGEERLQAAVLVARALEDHGAGERAARLAAAVRAELRPVESAADRGAAFNLAELARIRARRRSRIDEFVAAVDEMTAFAGASEERRARAAIAYAHVAIHRRVPDWRERLATAKRLLSPAAGVRVLRYAAMVEGYLCFVHGEWERAYDLSRVTTLSGSTPVLALQGEALHARAALALGRPWTRPEWTYGVLPGSPFQAELDALGAHHARRAGDAAEARRLAARALERETPFVAPLASAALGADVAELLESCDDLLVEIDLCHAVRGDERAGADLVPNR